MKITIWKTIIEKNGIDTIKHNHIEDGWVGDECPVPKSKIQQTWKNQKWIKSFGYLDGLNRVYEI